MTVLWRSSCGFLFGSLVSSGELPVLREFASCELSGAPVEMLAALVDGPGGLLVLRVKYSDIL